MAENKTNPTAKSVPEFLNQIPALKKLEDIDLDVLENLITTSIKRLKNS